MYEQRRPDVAVFIDFENVYVSVRDKLNANPNFEAIMDRCSDLGRVVISRAYADWYRYPRVTSALYANAIEPIYVATYYYDKDVGRTGRAIKNSVDMNLCIDAMKTLFTNPNINRFVLVTGDRDFIPLVNSIRQQGKEVYIIGIGGAASTHLAQSADEFVFYEQLVGRQPGGSATATAIANRATEFARGLELATEPPPRGEREPAPRELPVEPPPPAIVVTPPIPPTLPTPSADSDIYGVLVEAIHLVRKRGYVSTLGSIKLVMKELMGGEFKESRYRDVNGRPFVKFKDFVVDAEKRGKVQIFTNGTVNEVFLPGEDPYKLSQFAAALNEEVAVEPVVDTAVVVNGRKASARAEAVTVEQADTSARRRRRRSRRGQGSGQAAINSAAPLADEAEFDEPEYAPPVEASAPVSAQVTLRPLIEAATPSEFPEDYHPDDDATAGLPADLLAEAAALEETAAALGLVNLSHDPEPFEIGPAELVWDAAAIAIAAAEASSLAEATWDAAEIEAIEASEATPPAEVAAASEATPPAEAEAAEATPPAEVAAASEATPPAEVAADAPVTPEEAEPSVSEEEAEGVTEPIDFSETEWAIFTQMMRGFTKPASFLQIFDTLRAQRKAQQLVRTNEQLRTMVKQAINTGLIERSGRGKRVYYTLRPE